MWASTQRLSYFTKFRFISGKCYLYYWLFIGGLSTISIRVRSTSQDNVANEGLDVGIPYQKCDNPCGDCYWVGVDPIYEAKFQTKPLDIDQDVLAAMLTPFSSTSDFWTLFAKNIWHQILLIFEGAGCDVPNLFCFFIQTCLIKQWQIFQQQPQQNLNPPPQPSKPPTKTLAWLILPTIAKA